MTPMLSLVLANKHQQSGGQGRQTDSLKQVSVVRRRLNGRSSVFAFGLNDSLSDAAHCHLGGLATGLQVAQREGPHPSTTLSI